MGYAYENTPWHLVPDGEKFAIWEMNAKIRDSCLTEAELLVKLSTLDHLRQAESEK